MKVSEFATSIENVQIYAQWVMSGVLDGIKLSAMSCTNEHRDKTLLLWEKRGVKDITIEERQEVPTMPMYAVSVPTRGYGVEINIRATTQTAIEARLKRSGRTDKQVARANIKKVK